MDIVPYAPCKGYAEEHQGEFGIGIGTQAAESLRRADEKVFGNGAEAAGQRHHIDDMAPCLEIPQKHPSQKKRPQIIGCKGILKTIGSEAVLPVYYAGIAEERNEAEALLIFQFGKAIYKFSYGIHLAQVQPDDVQVGRRLLRQNGGPHPLRLVEITAGHNDRQTP